MPTDGELVGAITAFFISSHDFNGMPLVAVIELAKREEDRAELLSQLLRLVEERKLSLVFDRHQGNIHIKRFAGLLIDDQVRLFNETPAGEIAVYPTADTLKPLIQPDKYAGQPYTKRLALAEAQLVPVYFELKVLAPYFNDPRYICRFSDRDGYISITEAHYKSSQMRDKDKVLLETFGIGYDGDKNRVVVVYLRYLSDLSPQHQQIWAAHEIHEKCTSNSDYARATLYGAWPEFHSAYEAFIQEQREINRLCELIGWPSLFKETFEEDNRPQELKPMLIPTKKQFEAFAHALDKTLSENISKKIFQGDIDLEDKITASDGSIERRPIGTITLLQRWLTKHYRDKSGNDVSKEIVAPLRAVREARQRPAHGLDEDDYDLMYPRMQDKLLEDVIRTLTKLRLVLSAHPKARKAGYQAPEWLDGEKIVFY
jgi:hypothetical protein